jgi:hypothetical protein
MRRSRRGNEHSTLRDLAFLISGIGIGSATALLLASASGERGAGLDSQPRAQEAKLSC